MITVETLFSRQTSRSETSRSGVTFFSGLRNGMKGLADGWHGYSAYVALNSLNDAELAARGLTRADLPRLAFAEMKRRR